MVYITQNHWAPGLCPLSIILNIKKHSISECFGNWMQFPKHCFLILRITDDGQDPETQ
jgi:hypothetical protein